MNKIQAKAVHNEMRNLYLNKRTVDTIEKEIRELDEKIDSLNRPHSPRWDKVAKNSGSVDKERALLVLISDKQRKERDKAHFVSLIKHTEGMLVEIRTGLSPKEWQYLEEYFNSRNKQEVGYKYGYSNAHETAVSIIQKSDISKI